MKLCPPVGSELVLIIVIAAAVSFDFTNGFAWVITLPSAGLVAAAAWNISDIFGKNSEVGAIVIAVLAAAIAFGLWTLSKRNRVTAEDLESRRRHPRAGGRAGVGCQPGAGLTSPMVVLATHIIGHDESRVGDAGPGRARREGNS